jgi:hypothetical protein
MTPSPQLNSDFYLNHGQLICASFKRLIKRDLLKTNQSSQTAISQLFNAPFVLLSHGIEQDPLFNFGNRMALELFELDWQQLLKLPSRHSAEQGERKQREKYLKKVNTNGFIENYSSTRISATGQRFIIQNTIVWDLIDENNKKHGQAAMFKIWQNI